MHVPISNGRPTADDHVQNHESEGHRKGSSDVIAAFTTHEHCPAPTAFVRLWSLGSIETLPLSGNSPCLTQTLLVLLRTTTAGRFIVAEQGFSCGTRSVQASTSNIPIVLSQSCDRAQPNGRLRVLLLKHQHPVWTSRYGHAADCLLGAH